jgi:hypothetical protein
MRETGFSTTAPLQLECPPAGAPAVAVSSSSPADVPAPAVSATTDPGALSVLVHASGFVYMTETAEFPALLRDVRRDALRLVKDCLSVKKSSDCETDEARLSKLEEIGCRVLHVFAMELVFHECVLSAFREKVPQLSAEINPSQSHLPPDGSNATRDAHIGGGRGAAARRRAQGLSSHVCIFTFRHLVTL